MKEAHDEIILEEYKGEIYPKISFFNVAERNEKLKINFSDILLVITDEHERRNKLIWIKGKTEEYTLMNVCFTELLENSNNLMMVNKSTLLSMEAVSSYRYDFITLENLFPEWNNKQVTLSRKYRNDFYDRIEKS